jgi:ATP-dependent protease HslVU (ClpYQ) peptidase subunit
LALVKHVAAASKDWRIKKSLSSGKALLAAVDSKDLAVATQAHLQFMQNLKQQKK